MDVAPLILILPMHSPIIARLGPTVRLLGVRCAPYPDIHVSYAPSLCIIIRRFLRRLNVALVIAPPSLLGLCGFLL